MQLEELSHAQQVVGWVPHVRLLLSRWMRISGMKTEGFHFGFFYNYLKNARE